MSYWNNGKEDGNYDKGIKGLGFIQKAFASPTSNPHEGGCQNSGPFLGTLL